MMTEKQELKNYLIDTKGYSETEDLIDLNMQELCDLVTDWKEFGRYIGVEEDSLDRFEQAAKTGTFNNLK